MPVLTYLPYCVVFLCLQAYAAARFAESCMRALDGDSDVYECAYVQSDVRTPLTLFVVLVWGLPEVIFKIVLF